MGYYCIVKSDYLCADATSLYFVEFHNQNTILYLLFCVQKYQYPKNQIRNTYKLIVPFVVPLDCTHLGTAYFVLTVPTLVLPTLFFSRVSVVRGELRGVA